MGKKKDSIGGMGAMMEGAVCFDNVNNDSGLLKEGREYYFGKKSREN